MQYRVWVQRRTLALENFVVEAMNDREASYKAIKEAERVPIWEKPDVQLKVFEVEPLTGAKRTPRKRETAAA